MARAGLRGEWTGAGDRAHHSGWPRDCPGDRQLARVCAGSTCCRVGHNLAGAVGPGGCSPASGGQRWARRGTDCSGNIRDSRKPVAPWAGAGPGDGPLVRCAGTVDACSDPYACDGPTGLGCPADRFDGHAVRRNPLGGYDPGCEYETFGPGDCPSEPPPSPPADPDDSALDQGEPDCNNPQNSMEVEYCNGRVPEGTELDAFNAALGRLRGISSTCGQLADAAEALMTAGRFRIFTFSSQSFGGAAPLGGDWAIIGDGWFGHWELNTTPEGANLQSAIAHEMDHHLNHVVTDVTDIRGHIIEGGVANGSHTLNSAACA